MTPRDKGPTSPQSKAPTTLSQCGQEIRKEMPQQIRTEGLTQCSREGKSPSTDLTYSLPCEPLQRKVSGASTALWLSVKDQWASLVARDRLVLRGLTCRASLSQRSLRCAEKLSIPVPHGWSANYICNYKHHNLPTQGPDHTGPMGQPDVTRPQATLVPPGDTRAS